MTEAEWLACEEPTLLTHLERGGAATRDRKFWLFAVESCRRVWGLIRQACCRRAVGEAERFADGEVPRQRLVQSWEEISSVMRKRPGEPAPERTAADRAAFWLTVHAGHAPTAAWNASLDTALAVAHAAFPEDGRGVWTIDAHSERWKAAYRAEQAGEAAALRDIFGPPHSAVSQCPSRSPDVVTLAGHIYHDRAFGLMPDLADAMEEAGCTDADLLTHLRSPDLHVRGCWALDLVLDRG